MTVAGLTMRRAERHSAQAPQNQAHKSRSNRFSFGFFTERCSTPSWWRRAMISSCNAARVRKTDSVDASNADITAVNWELTEDAQLTVSGISEFAITTANRLNHRIAKKACIVNE
jgi:hypothetical protein